MAIAPPAVCFKSRSIVWGTDRKCFRSTTEGGVIFEGGRRVRFDASVSLRRLSNGENVWPELWDNLHHQGDVGEASYAAVPHLVQIAGGQPRRDWNLYGLVGTIEIARHHSIEQTVAVGPATWHHRPNPPLPEWLETEYRAAWRELLRLALDDLPRAGDTSTVQAILGAVAVAKGDLKLGEMILHSDRSEIDEYVDRSVG